MIFNDGKLGNDYWKWLFPAFYHWERISHHRCRSRNGLLVTLHAPRLSCQRVNLETIMHEGLRHKITMVNKAMICLYKESGPGVGVGEIKGSKLVHTS